MRRFQGRIDQSASPNSAKPFQPFDLDCFGGVYAILNAFQLALTPYGGLPRAEALACTRLGIRHLSFRRSAMDITFTSGMTMKRAHGLARLFARQVSNGQRRIAIETPTTDLNRSIDGLLAWIEVSLSQGMPVVAMLDGDRRRFVTISGIDADKLYFYGGERTSIRREDCAVRRGLFVFSATGMFRVQVDWIDHGPHTIRRPRVMDYEVTTLG